MKQFRISFDRTARLWAVRSSSHLRPHLAQRLVLDAKAKSEWGELIVLADVRPEGEATIIDDHVALPGEPKPKEMREWCVVYDEGTGKWVIYRQDDESIVVTTTILELDCHGITSDGVLHCLAEMIVYGRTNRRESIEDAPSVLLRTLCVYDQTVLVKPIAIRSRAKSPI